MAGTSIPIASLIISCIPRFFEFGVIYHVMYRTASFGVFLSLSVFFFGLRGRGVGVGMVGFV